MKVGDEVRITEDPEDFHNIGDIGTVVRLRDDDYYEIDVKVDGEEREGAYNFDEVELLDIIKESDDPAVDNLIVLLDDISRQRAILLEEHARLHAKLIASTKLQQQTLNDIALIKKSRGEIFNKA